MTWLLEGMTPRFFCIGEELSLAWWYSFVSLGIATAYGFIMCYYSYKVRNKAKQNNHVRVLSILFLLFFFFCGGSHLFNALAFSYAPYRLFALWDTIQFCILVFLIMYLQMCIKKYGVFDD